MTVIKIKQGDTFTRTITLMSQANLIDKGIYKAAYTYRKNDLVVDNNVVYYSKLDSNKGNATSNATYWGTPTAINLSSSTLTGGLRDSYRDEGTIIDFTTALVTDGTDGKFTISLTATQTKTLDFDECYFDVQVTTGTVVKTYLTGKIQLEREYY